jgi:hypothetical protein
MKYAMKIARKSLVHPMNEDITLIKDDKVEGHAAERSSWSKILCLINEKVMKNNFGIVEQACGFEQDIPAFHARTGAFS